MPLHPAAAGAIALYLEAAGHGADKTAPLFQPVSNNTRGAGRAIMPGGVYQMLDKYAADAGIEVEELRRRAGAGKQKLTLAREFGISRETLYQYLKVAPTP